MNKILFWLFLEPKKNPEIFFEQFIFLPKLTTALLCYFIDTCPTVKMLQKYNYLLYVTYNTKYFNACGIKLMNV